MRKTVAFENEKPRGEDSIWAKRAAKMPFGLDNPTRRDSESNEAIDAARRFNAIDRTPLSQKATAQQISQADIGRNDVLDTYFPNASVSDLIDEWPLTDENSSSASHTPSSDILDDYFPANREQDLSKLVEEWWPMDRASTSALRSTGTGFPSRERRPTKSAIPTATAPWPKHGTQKTRKPSATGPGNGVEKKGLFRSIFRALRSSKTSSQLATNDRPRSEPLNLHPAEYGVF